MTATPGVLADQGPRGVTYLEPPVFPMIDPFGSSVEIHGKARRDVLIGRGYFDEVRPEPPPVPALEPRDVAITATVVHAPWATDRAENITRYPIPGLIVVADSEREGCWPTVQRAWRTGAELGGTHHLMVTDDLSFPIGSWEALQVAVGMFPASPISLLSVRPGAKLAYDAGWSWCICWGVTGAASVIPVGMIEPFLEWDAENMRDDCPHDDVRLTAFCTDQRIGVLTPVPCLVTHGDFPSVIEDSPLFGRKHAPATIYVEDVRDVDWSKGAQSPVFIGISVERPGTWLRDGRSLADMREGSSR